MNNELFSQLYDASEYYRVCDIYDKKIMKLKADIQNCKERYTGAKGKKKSSSGFNIIFMGFGLVLILVSFAGGKSGFLLGLILLGMIAPIVAFNALRCKAYNNKHAKRADKLWQEKLGPAIAKAEKDIQRANQQLMKYKAEHSKNISFLPNEYRNYSATSYMAIAVRNGRADTFKEAANLYEEQLHRWRLEAINEEIAAQNWAIQNNLVALGQRQAETNKLLKEIENLEFYNTLSNYGV